MEVLSDFQVSIPELGTVVATQMPLVFLTSNGTRELSEALKRRCLYLYLDYPTSSASGRSSPSGCRASRPSSPTRSSGWSRLLRSLELQKHPSISETLDWARTLVLLGIEHVDADTTTATLNLLLKYKADIDVATKELSGTSARR